MMSVILENRAVRIGVWRLVVAVATLTLLVDNGQAASPAAACPARKYKAAELELYQKAKCYQRSLIKPSFLTSDCLAKVEQKFIAAFANADSKGGCVAQNNASEVAGVVDACLVSFTTAITGDANCAAAKTKAVGRRAYDEMRCRLRALLSGASVDTQCIGKADLRLSAVIAKADELGTCTDGTTALKALVDGCMTALHRGCGDDANSFNCGGACTAGSVCTGASTFPWECSCAPTCAVSEWPACGGVCDPGWTCAEQVGFPPSCGCVPSCVTSEAPTCGGSCPNGQLCGKASGSDSCMCATPDNTCTISEAPACGGTCPNGWICGPYHGFGSCGCVSPEYTCAIAETPTCGGTCPTGQVCTQSSVDAGCLCM